MVVSLVPNFNRCLYESVRQARPLAPFVTVMTDLADLPPHFWIESGQQQHIVCGSARAVQQALDAGHASGRVHRSSGMIIRPDFYREPPTRRHALRASLGLDPDRPVGLVMFGGHGARQMLDLARAMDDTQFIFLCGGNAELVDRLGDLHRRAPHMALGYTDKVAFYMSLADFFIGKPGPGCISEALQSGLPVVTWDNEATIPQERFNAQWLRELGAGLVVPGLPQVPQAVAALLGDLPTWQHKARAVRNQAVFELPGILEKILRQAGVLAPLAPGEDAEREALAA
jgi:UDP-N-acetylglucosamine:LPS N-acetylglucosamine transferase